MPEKTRDGIGLVLLAHRIGELDAAEAQSIISDLLDVNDLHTATEAARAARRRYERQTVLA